MEVFDPVLYSIPENEFLLEHLGQSPIVAMRDVTGSYLPNPNQKDKNPTNYPSGVVPAAVKPVLERVYELQELEKHSNEPWVGVEALRSAIRTYLAESKRWATDQRRNRVRFPSMSTYDSKGKPHRGAVGSDSGQVKTYFDEHGNRVPFAVELVPSGRAEWAPPGAAIPAPVLALIVDADKRRIECSVCAHTESFKPESRASFNAARARMSKHLRIATEQPDAHRELHTNEFGG